MLKLPENKPEDEDFINRANEDPNWPKDLDKPVDWRRVSLWRKIWFKIGEGVKTLVAFILMVVLGTALFALMGVDGESFDDPYCNPSPQGCYE